MKEPRRALESLHDITNITEFCLRMDGWVFTSSDYILLSAFSQLLNSSITTLFLVL